MVPEKVAPSWHVPGAPALVSLFKALDVAPVSMQYGEIYAALQTRFVDGQENPLSQIDSGNFYEVQKYMSLTNHVWDGFWIIANGPAWKRLPPDVQAVASKVLNEKALLQRSDLAALNQTLADQLRGKGLQVNTADSDTFRAKLRQAGFYDTWHKQIGDDAWNLLEHYAGKLG